MWRAKEVICSLVSVVLAQGIILVGGMQAQERAVLTVALRDSYGKPLTSVRCEILSYNWGLQPGQSFAVIARGETDRNGMVAFDVTDYPRNGYRFRFTKTDRTQPADTYFEADATNQYRGYPDALIGGKSELYRFVIGGDGLAYNDLAGTPATPPVIQRDPVGGLDKPRPTVLSPEEFWKQALAATQTAQANGAPTPTRPPRPAPFTPGTIFTALPSTAGAEQQPTSTIAPVTQVQASITPTAILQNPTATAQNSSIAQVQTTAAAMVQNTTASTVSSPTPLSQPGSRPVSQPEAQDNAFGSILVIGLGCLLAVLLVAIYRKRRRV
jgi:hypothetical protein